MDGRATCNHMKKLQAAIKAAPEGTFIPNREKDELTKSLRNPEHPGRTRDTPGSVPWVHMEFPTSVVVEAERERVKRKQPKCRVSVQD